MRRMQQGFSLAELLVCFALSMLLIAVLIQHVLSVSRAYRHIHDVWDEAAELQWVFDVIKARVRHAGFTPCRSLSDLQTIDTRETPELLQSLEVQAGVKLLIRKMHESRFGLARRLTPDTLRMRELSLKPDRAVIIADCQHAEVHDVARLYQSPHGLLIQLKKPLVFDYSPEMYVGEWVSEAFFFRPAKGLLIKQQRVDWIARAQRIQFRLEYHANYSKVLLNWTSKLGKQYKLEVRARM